MGFRTSTVALPRIATYDDASHIEAGIKPIRGRSVETKPLGKRSNDSVTIRRDRDKIIIRMYSTDILAYEKMDDGQTMIRICSGGWASQSTAKVIAHILGTHVCVRGGCIWVSSVGYWYALHHETGHVLNVTTRGDRHYTPVDYLPPMVTKIDKSGLGEVRKQYKAFKQYMRRMCKALAGAEGLITDIPECDTWGYSTYQVLTYARYEGEGKPDEATLHNFYTGMVILMNCTATNGWTRTNGGGYTLVRSTSYKRLYSRLDEYIKHHHHDEVTYKERFNNSK